jgi:hypothetical protein
MSSVAELERIQGIVAALQGIGNAQRGDLIRAQQWNDLVSIVGSVAQMVLTALQQERAVPPHDHPDQVKLSWLDPSLRALVEKGSLSDPALVSRLGELNSRVSRLEARLDQVRDDTVNVRDRFAELSTRELVRDATIRDVRVLAEAQTIPEEKITGIREILGTQLRSELTVTLDKLRGDVTTDVDKKLATVDSSVAQRINDRVPLAVDAALISVKTQITKTADDLRAEAKSAAEKSAAGAADSVRGDLTKLIDQVQTGIGPAIKKELDTTLPVRFAEVQTAVATVQKNAEAALTKVNAQATELQAAKARAEQIALQSDAAVKAAQQSLLEELNKRGAADRVTLDKRFVEFEGKVDTRIDTRLTPRLTDFRNELTTTIQTTATNAATSAVKAERVQISAEMVTIARDQSLALKDQVVAQVRADVDPVIKQSVLTEVKRTSATPLILTPVRPIGGER